MDKNNSVDIQDKNIYTLIDFSENINGGSMTYAQLLHQGLLKLKRNIKLIRPNNASKKFLFRVSKLLNLFVYLLKILRINILNKNTIFITHHPISAFFLLAIKNKSVYYICHGPWGDEYKDINKKKYFYKLNYSLREKIQTYILQNSQKVFFVSEYMFNYVNEKLRGELGNRFIQILGPIIDSSSIKSSFLNGSRKNGVIVRRLVPRTGVLDLLIKLQKEKICIDVNIVGTGNQFKDIQRLSKTSLSKVFVKGELSDAERNEIFKKSIVCILPSIALEGFGLVILEAISFGCIPIVSNMAGGGRDWLIKYDANIVYDGSVKDLNRAINYAIKNYDYLDRILKKEINQFLPTKVAIKVFN